MVSVLDMSHKTIKAYWHSSDILNNISTTWVEVSVKCLKGLWGKICEHRNINICCSSIYIYIYIYIYIHTHISCSFIIKRYKLNLKKFNNIININHSDKCANECPELDTKHWHKPVWVQISFQPLEARKISWSHDIHPCMWHSYSGTDIQWKMSVWPPLSINVNVHYKIFVQLLPV